MSKGEINCNLGIIFACEMAKYCPEILPQNDYSIVSNYFLTTFSTILEKLMKQFVDGVPKPDFGPKWPYFGTLAKFAQNENFSRFYCPPASCQVSKKSFSERF